MNLYFQAYRIVDTICIYEEMLECGNVLILIFQDVMTFNLSLMAKFKS